MPLSFSHVNLQQFDFLKIWHFPWMLLVQFFVVGNMQKNAAF